MPDTQSQPESIASDPAFSPDERAELDRLRAEVTELRAGQAAAPHRRRRVGWRGPVATLLIVLGCVLAPVSVVAVWTANQVSDTGRYVASLEPLIHEPAVTIKSQAMSVYRKLGPRPGGLRRHRRGDRARA